MFPLFLCPCPQADDRKASLAAGAQATPPGMIETSEEEDLEAAEEVKRFTELEIQSVPGVIAGTVQH